MPDIVITDPARPGMDAALIDIFVKSGAKRSSSRLMQSADAGA